MLRLFRPQIVNLLRERDKRVAAWLLQHADSNVYEDRDLNVTSELMISVRGQIAAIDKAGAQQTQGLGRLVRQPKPRPCANPNPGAGQSKKQSTATRASWVDATPLKNAPILHPNASRAP